MKGKIMSNRVIWTSTKDIMAIHGEDNVFARHDLNRVSPEMVPYLRDFKWGDDLTRSTNHEVQVYVGDVFFRGLKEIMGHIVSGSDYSMRKVTICYVPEEKSVYLLGGNTFIQSCYKCDVTSGFGKKLDTYYTVQISYDVLKEYVDAITKEFRVKATSLLMKKGAPQIAIACQSDDIRLPEPRSLLFSADIIPEKDVDSDSVLEMFSQYDEGNDCGYQTLYRINADSRLKSVFSGKQSQMQFIQRRGLLSLKMVPDHAGAYAVEIPTACPLIPMTDSGMVPEGDVVANVNGRDIYEAMSFSKEDSYNIDIIGKVDGAKAISPCIRIDNSVGTVLISQNIHIKFPETGSFVMKKGNKLVEATEGEALKKAAKAYTPKNMPAESKAIVDEALVSLGERVSQLERNLEKLNDRLKANDALMSKLVNKLEAFSKTIDDLKEPAIVETPEMAETLNSLPSAKDTANLSRKVKEYLVKHAGNVVNTDVIIQEVPGAVNNIRAYLGTCVQFKRLYRLESGVYYVPSDVGIRFAGGLGSNLPFKLKDFPENIINRYGLKDKL